MTVRSERLRRGFTSGACVQAATRAAALSVAAGLTGGAEAAGPAENQAAGDVAARNRGGRCGPPVDRAKAAAVEVVLPGGDSAVFPVAVHGEGVCSIVKDAGDDPDVTGGMRIFVRVAGRGDGRFFVRGEEGVGRVTLAGLPVKPGRSAINPVPLKHIHEEARRVLPRGAEVTVWIPGGEKLASRTFNPRLGIVGGLSILGTTGRIEPWSASAYQESLIPQLDVARAAGRRRLVLVPGAKGERAALAAGFEPGGVVQTGNYAGMMLAAARDRGFRRLTLLGHASKLAKLARGDFNTHSRSSAMPLDVLAEAAVACGWSRRRAAALTRLTTTEAAITRLLEAGAGEVLDEAARRVAARVEADFGLKTEILLTNARGAVIGRA